MTVRAKKHLGQHFLNDKNIAHRIVDSLETEGVEQVLEVGPGMGVLTQFLMERSDAKVSVVEIDTESVAYLKENYPALKGNIIEYDFLKLDLNNLFEGAAFRLIGNFPYNISSQIFFKVLENRNQIPEVVGMIQKEVAERISTGPGSKTYGILSVLLQAWYDIEYLFTVHENVFTPPPKVKSGVIRLKRNDKQALGCDEKLFFRVVKQSFNMRRKTLRNSLKGQFPNIDQLDPVLLKMRPEQLNVGQFVDLTNKLQASETK